MSIKNLTYVLKMVIILFAISYLLDKVVFYSLNILNSKIYTGQGTGKMNQFLKIKDNANLLVFGSSRANHNVDNVRIDSNSYNIGVDGTSIAFTATLIKLLESNSQTLLIQTDPEMAIDSTYIGKDIEQLKTLYNKNPIVKNEFKKLNFDNPFQNVYWSISYNSKVFGMVSNYLRPKYDYKSYYGYDPIKVSNEQKIIFENILKQKKNIPCTERLVENNIFTNYLKELKQIAQTKNKTLIFFTSPVYDDYCKNDNDFLSKLMFENNLEYMDFTDLFKTKNKIEYWKDETHLSEIGASLFTDSLKINLTNNKNKRINLPSH